MKEEHRNQPPTSRSRSPGAGHAVRRPRNHSHHEAAEKIHAEHDDLREHLHLLKRTRDFEVLIPELQALRQSLIRHFALEEGPGGFRPILTGNAPHHLDHMQRLFDEHKGFLTTLALLLDRAEAKREGERKEILEEVAMLVARLRVHESEETQLLSDSLYTDLGESS